MLVRDSNTSSKGVWMYRVTCKQSRSEEPHIDDLRIFELTRLHSKKYCSMGEGGMLSSKKHEVGLLRKFTGGSQSM